MDGAFAGRLWRKFGPAAAYASPFARAPLRVVWTMRACSGWMTTTLGLALASAGVLAESTETGFAGWVNLTLYHTNQLNYSAVRAYCQCVGPWARAAAVAASSTS